MEAEQPFAITHSDGARYSVDVIRDGRDDANPHYDVDLVRAMTGRFGESLEQRLTLAEYDDRQDAQQHRQQIEGTLDEVGLAGMGAAGEQIVKEPVLYDGQYLFVTYPPEAEGQDRAAAHVLWLREEGIETRTLGEGPQVEMAVIAQDAERGWTLGEPVRDQQFERDGMTYETERELETHQPEDSAAWQFETRQAVTPTGEALGTLLYMTVYPADFTDSRDPAEVPAHQRSIADEERLVLRGFDAEDRMTQPLPDDTGFHARALEVGHFRDTQAADTFAADFQSYLIPGLLDGPELAEEVAKLEGLSGQWQALSGDGLKDFMDDRQPVVVAREDWRVYNPNAERDARDAFENPSNPNLPYDLSL